MARGPVQIPRNCRQVEIAHRFNCPGDDLFREARKVKPAEKRATLKSCTGVLEHAGDAGVPTRLKNGRALTGRGDVFLSKEPASGPVSNKIVWLRSPRCAVSRQDNPWLAQQMHFPEAIRIPFKL